MADVNLNTMSGARSAAVLLMSARSMLATKVHA
jgi:hypothetical protein